MKLYYCQHPDNISNFGDNLNPWLWDKFLPGVFDDNEEVIFVGIGTLLNDYIQNLFPQATKIIFGSGVGYRQKLEQIDHLYQIICVRGPLSARALGLDENYGITDPAILVRRYVSAHQERRYHFTFMPHIGSANATWESICKMLGYGYIDPRSKIEDILEKLCSADILITESLHGAIVADALRIPWIPVVIGPLYLKFKWLDWCASLGIEYKPYKLMPLWHPPISTWADIRLRIKQKIIIRLLKRLVQKARPVLSDKSILELKTQQLEEKLDIFRNEIVLKRKNIGSDARA